MSAEEPESFADYLIRAEKDLDKSRENDSKKINQPPQENVDFSLDPKQQEVVDEIKKEENPLDNISPQEIIMEAKAVVEEKIEKDYKKIIREENPEKKLARERPINNDPALQDYSYNEWEIRNKNSKG